MKVNWRILLNLVILSIFMMLVCGFQTSFWFQLFGNVPAPLLWINLIVYITLYRKPFYGILFIYALGFIAAAFSAIPLKMIFISSLILFALIYTFKSRVFWSGSGYYTLMCAVGSVVFHVTYFLISMLLERNSTTLLLTERMVQIILTPSFAFPMYWLLVHIDQWTRCENLQESGGVEL